MTDTVSEGGGGVVGGDHGEDYNHYIWSSGPLSHCHTPYKIINAPVSRSEIFVEICMVADNYCDNFGHLTCVSVFIALGSSTLD